MIIAHLFLINPYKIFLKIIITISDGSKSKGITTEKPKPQYFPKTLSVSSSISIHSSKLPKSITLPLRIPVGIFEEESNTETKNLLQLILFSTLIEDFNEMK